ncbi:hypothetical protein ALC57_15946 [Trachymyrmex cornetzi]|uniref:Uncharacterized protein n=1 Tax=Trachymyrmex cornetzi TaxID=471704 RepID=A0A195DFY7_9HYME|nr:hypothetical protein ALC57_15946 [Trachymyrmex cornetzi]
MCDLISRCRGTMVPASASARRSTPASRDPALWKSVERVGNAHRGTISRKILSCSSAIDFVSHQRKKMTATRDDQHTGGNRFDS